MGKPLPNALDIDVAGGFTEEVTPHAGVALLIEMGRRAPDPQGPIIPGWSVDEAAGDHSRLSSAWVCTSGGSA